VGHPSITDEDVATFERDGFVVKRAFFSAAEIDLIGAALRADPAIQDRAYGLADGQGGRTLIAVWNHPGDDTLGLVPRLERMAGGMDRLLGGEVYHYHSKVTSKAAGGGGTWEWHQDYGYWYKNGCLFPDMGSVAIAVSPQTVENGALRLLRGSHRCGRIEHALSGGQTGADPRRVAELERCLETVTFHAAPGDALFFHSNTLHSSSPNVSDGTREVLLCCYNRASNDPFITHHHPRYTPLEHVGDDALVVSGLTMDGHRREFMDPATDISIGEFSPAITP
jgi:hypothetical protein